MVQNFLPLATSSVVTAAAKQHNADLIVMGTHGRGLLARAVLGSVADGVIRHAECPVLTVSRATAARTQPGTAQSPPAPQPPR